MKNGDEIVNFEENAGFKRKLKFIDYVVYIPTIFVTFFILTAKYFFPNSEIIQNYFTGYWQIIIFFLFFLSFLLLAVVEYFIRKRLKGNRER